MKTLSALKLTLGFGGVLLLLIANFWIENAAQQELIRNERLVKHTYEVLREIESDVSLAKDVETGARGYVISGQRAFLEPFDAAQKKVEDKLEPLYTMVKDNPPQQKRVLELSDLVGKKLEVARRQVALVDAGKRAEAVKFTASGEGKFAMDAVRAKANEMRAVEEALLQNRSNAAANATRNARLALWISVLTTLVLLGLVYGGLVRAKAQSEELEEQRDALKTRGAELQNALSELERLEGMRDSLTAMLVHDLRTPLTTLIGPLQMLESDDESFDVQTRHEIVGMSRQSAERLLGLVNELLDISKMEAGEMSLRRESVNPQTVIDEAIKHLNLASLGGAARIEREAAPDLPLLQADEELLTRILINLLGNAEKFTPSSGKIVLGARATTALEVLPPRLQPDEKEKTQPQYQAPCVLFCVRDSGEGIPASDLDRIFDKFGQVETREAGRKMSTGLGLTFCKLAVEAHGGLIWVESELKKGSTFYFTIPLRERDAVEENASETKHRAQAVNALDGAI